MVINIFTTTYKLYCIVFLEGILVMEKYYSRHDYLVINQEKDNGYQHIYYDLQIVLYSISEKDLFLEKILFVL
jgi:hypothetical protein